MPIMNQKPVTEQELQQLSQTTVVNDNPPSVAKTTLAPVNPQEYQQPNHTNSITSTIFPAIVMIAIVVLVAILAPKIKLKRKNKPPELLIIRHEARIEHAKEREIRRKARAKRLFRNLK